MQHVRHLLLVFITTVLISTALHAQEGKTIYSPEGPMPPKFKVDTRIDNMSYWRRMVLEGLVPVAPDVKAPAPILRSSRIFSQKVTTDDSPDVPVTGENCTQTENSIFVNPNDNQIILNSNNSTSNPANGVYGANAFYSEDGGDTWDGQLEGTGGQNSGDPAAVIGLNGRYYNGFIHSNGGQGVAYSDDNGATWTSIVVQPGPSGWNSMLDKNHLWIDNSPSSPYEGYLYDAWTNFGGSNDKQIEIARSIDDGASWESSHMISGAVNAGSHNQGVNIQTGPGGEVYALWTIYDNWPSDEDAMAMARSLDGGATWEPSHRIIDNIRGIRNTGVSKAMRVNAFPCMAVDISSGPNSGTIYAVWCNTGVPGINTGNDKDIYLIKSSDQGDTWSDPIRVNQDPAGLGKEHYLPWITCDPESGSVSVIFYDDRNVSSSQCETFVANSTDGGETWEDFRVSDVAFTPQSIPGLADGYMGDYLGIVARGRKVYPLWSDTRSGVAMAYTSPYETGPEPNQPYITYASHELHDAAGNNNGQADFGESITLDVELENIGDQPASDVEVVLSTESEFATITDANETYGNMAVGDLKMIPEAFAIDIDETAPNAYTVVLDVSATDANDSVFVSHFSFDIAAPKLEVTNMTVNDAAGNNNGQLDPGEEVILTVHTDNTGVWAAENVHAALNCASAFVSIETSSVDLGTINAGEGADAAFTVTISENSPIGTAVDFEFSANSDSHSGTKTFTKKIGIIIEDWESGDFASFDWVQGGDADWVIVSDETFEGQYAAKSGSIADQKSTSIEVEYNVANADTIWFQRKVSSESGYDFLKFFIDNNMLGQWSGDEDWAEVYFPVAAGNHTFKWVYQKDYSSPGGSDEAWIDFIVFPAELVTTAFAGTDEMSCMGAQFHCQGVVSNAASINWTTAGTGSFDDATVAQPFYTPSQADFDNGSVTLTLTVVGNDNVTKTDEVVVSFVEAPEFEAGNDAEVCANGSYLMAEAAGSNIQSLIWSTDGDGTFDDIYATQPTYTPGTNDIANGSAAIMVVAQGGTGCDPVTDQLTLTILPIPATPEIVAGQTILCQGSETTFSVDEVTHATSYNWQIMPEAAGSFTENTASATLSLADDFTGEANITAVAVNSCGESAASEALTITITEGPVVELGNDTILCADKFIILDASSAAGESYLWSPGGETTASITVDTTGTGLGSTTYAVEVNSSTGCVASDEIKVTFEDCTGIEETLNNVAVRIFPNPNNGRFTLELQSPQHEKVSVALSDASNRMVRANREIQFQGIYTQEFDIRSLNKGIYMLILEQDGQRMIRKIIFQ